MADVVELVDIFPTVDALTGRAGEEVDGESLLPSIDGSRGRIKHHAISELAPTYVQGVAPATDFDRVQAESRSAELAVHPSYADMAPNQYRAAESALTDAEQFYDCPSWTRPTGAGEPRITRVRPEAPTAP